ncbi:MAG: ATP-binding cassette domain-containing protein [Acidobacteriota bacterium]
MSILLDRLVKRFGPQAVVDRLSLEIRDGELFVLLGASGSGKSTALRMVAGLVEPDAGKVFLHGADVTQMPPQKRGIGFVFQNYSVFRHMTAAANVEFGLRIRGVAAAERLRRREELLDLVGLGGLGPRYADQLSGGQQQRVALARALAYEPSVLLLDEPFGALDVRIRAQLRRTLKDIQRQLRVTTVLVTHDQEEAFELADRIGLMERGRLLETAEPETLYYRPRTLSAAAFVGGGAVLVGRARGGRALFGPVVVPLAEPGRHEEESRVRLLLRPEQVTLCATPPAAGQGQLLGHGTVLETSFLGALRRVRVRLPAPPDVRQASPPLPSGEVGLVLEASAPADAPPPSGEAWVVVRGGHVLDPPRSRILLCTRGGGGPFALARRLQAALDGVVDVLALAESADEVAGLEAALAQRAAAEDLDAAAVRVRVAELGRGVEAEQGGGWDLIIARWPDPPLGSPRLLREVLRSARAPVLLVRGDRSEITRVLICTAVGEPGKSDVRIGGRLARRLGASATLFHAALPDGPPSELVRLHLERGLATLRTLEVPGKTRVRESEEAADAIVAEAREGEYDLVVIGRPRSLGAAGARSVLRLLGETGRSLLIVPPEE